jgi:hypothetical protein
MFDIFLHLNNYKGFSAENESLLSVIVKEGTFRDTIPLKRVKTGYINEAGKTETTIN